MHSGSSCIAPSELPHCKNIVYIHFNDDASRAESKLQGDYHVTLAHPHDPGVRDYQRNVSELSSLAIANWADIGLDRSDIPRVAAGPTTADCPSRRITNG